MKSYIIKPKSVRKSEILENEYSFSGFSYRFVECENKNILLLGSDEVLEKNIKGFEPGSKEYIDFSKNYFVRISEMDDLNFTFTISKDTKKIRPENSNKSKTINQGDICYQTASNAGNVCIYNGKKAFYNSHIIKLTFKKNKYYIFAILKSVFGKEQVDVSGSIKGIDNFRKEYLLNTKIPFPTIKNNLNPDQIENLVVLIVRNIINKEEQIKLKNKQIDELIEKELKNNQKAGKFSYSYPRISEIREETRLDTGLYKRDFKEIDFLIRNYERNITFIDEKNIEGGNTPKERIFGKGNLWFTPTDCKNGILVNKNLIKTQKYNLNDDYLVIVNRSNVAQAVLFKKDVFKIGHHNQGMYRVKINKDNYNYFLFLLSWFNSSTFQKYIGNVATGATFKEIRIDDISKKSPIPNFPESKQQEIVKRYYNPFKKNIDLSLENYLEKEQARNGKVGIFQLNIEIFTLREQLEYLVHKIVMEEAIEVKF
jgi:hypothetical protein